MLDYIQGLHKLKQCLPDEVQQDFHVLEARLLESMQKADLYGDTSAYTAEKMAAIAQLNKLASRYCEESFNEMSQEQPAWNRRGSAKRATATEAAGAPGREPQPLSDPTSVAAQVAVKLLAPVVPTAYCKNLDVDEFPLFQVVVDTTDPHCARTRLLISSWIEGYSDKQFKTIELEQGKKEPFNFFPLFQHDVVKQLNEVRQVTLHVHIEWMRPEKDDHYDTMRIRLLAYDAALLALEREDGSVVDLSHYLVAWVTPNDPGVQAFLDNVVRRHSRHELEGYPDPFTCDDPSAFIREQVQAVYEALKYDAHMKYVDASLVIGNPKEQIMQRVKRPAETLAAKGKANCLDGTVLFASLLEAIGLQPLIMLERGHAYLGWKIFVPGKEEQYEFLETTLIDSADFEAAQQRGLARYQSALDNHLFDRPVTDMYGYARRIDVLEWHKSNIHPL